MTCRRQTVSKLGCTSCRRATSTTLAEGAWLSSTIRSFSIVDHRRRRSGPDKIETLLTFARANTTGIERPDQRVL